MVGFGSGVDDWDDDGVDEPGVEAGGFDDDATVDAAVDCSGLFGCSRLADCSELVGCSVGAELDDTEPVDTEPDDSEPDDTELAAADVLGAGSAPASFGEQATRAAVTSTPETRAQIRRAGRKAPARSEAERLCGVPLSMVSPETSSTRCFGQQ